MRAPRRAFVSPARTPDAEARLCALEATVAVLSARLDVLEPVSDPDFLAAVAMSVKGCVFTVKELLAHADVDQQLRRVLSGMSARRLGNKLRRLAVRDVSGFRLTRVKREESGCIWTVLHVDAGIEPARGAR